MPVALDGERLELVELLERVAAIAARHGVGIVDHIEDRIVGLKVRDIYEVPAAAVLLPAHDELERLVCTIHQNQFKAQLDHQWAYLVYAGLWWEPLRGDLDAYMERVNERVSGTIAMKLYKGHARVVTRCSPNAVYDASLASFSQSGGLFSQSASPGLHRAVVAAVAHGVATAQRVAPAADAGRGRRRLAGRWRRVACRSVNSNGYKLLGLLVWRGGKWYVAPAACPRRAVLALSPQADPRRGRARRAPGAPLAATERDPPGARAVRLRA